MIEKVINWCKKRLEPSELAKSMAKSLAEEPEKWHWRDEMAILKEDSTIYFFFGSYYWGKYASVTGMTRRDIRHLNNAIRQAAIRRWDKHAPKQLTH